MENKYSFKIFVLVCLLITLGPVGWTVQAAAADNAQSTTSVFKVEGMTCGGCEVGVKMKVKKLEGVEKVTASYEEGTATVTYRPETVTPEQIVTAIEDLGYSAHLDTSEESPGTGSSR